LSQEIQPTRTTSPAPSSRLVTVSTPVPSLRRELRGPALIGAAVLVAFFVVGGGWAATAPLSGAAIAPGVVSPEGSRRRVQHLEGGIVREILVKDGDRVEAGDVLMTLATIGPQSEVGQLMSRLRTLAATEARLMAEREGSKEIAFNHPVLSDRTQPEIREVIEQQVHQLVARRANDASQESILTQRIAQLQQQIVGTEQQLLSVRRQNELIKEEVLIVKDMYEKGYERKSRLLSLQRAEADLTGQEGELLSRIARAEEQIGETKLQIVNITVKRKEDIDQQLSDTQSRRNEVEQQINESLDRLSRTTLVAPVSGTVLDLRFKTIGGVIRPGEEVLSIVPTTEKLVIDARLSPQDIDDVHAGQDAYVIFPSFPQRGLHRIEARVRTVSADALQEEHTGKAYYKAEVEIDRERLHKLDPRIELLPGMPAEAFIATTERTLLEYLIQPFLLAIEHSFREH
jgi:HlyD family secretion protein